MSTCQCVFAVGSLDKEINITVLDWTWSRANSNSERQSCLDDIQHNLQSTPIPFSPLHCYGMPYSIHLPQIYSLAYKTFLEICLGKLSFVLLLNLTPAVNYSKRRPCNRTPVCSLLVYMNLFAYVPLN